MTDLARPSGPTTTVAACQLRIDIDDPEGNRRRVVTAVDDAVARGAGLVVLPELVTSGYVFADLAEARERSEPVDGPTVTLLTELSARHGIVLVAGFCERSDGERPFNSLAVLDSGRLLAVYRKTHLWGTEKAVFAVGDALAPVVETRVGVVAAMICYDLEFPEMVRDVALRGAQIVVAPSNWPSNSPPPGERAPEVVKAQASAAVNRVFVVVTDRVGTERGVVWIGGSVICDVEGYPVAGPAQGEETTLLAELDLGRALAKDVGPYNHAFTDRRPDLY
ncbi:Predicted amidohydrolase [Friedmanniella luteola]|uniref:Predicted amidohydrolase n=1 Tax=Friedmanniella luteola TaxID=546871 RepID=A0A1H2A4R9_9ACTN|nr:nitrilase-related carbon-nitrogen hydrolase [Friedmanniella luteola]SDT40792.1 Predicted amidohydrolase [Friedmanniella luteola]